MGAALVDMSLILCGAVQRWRETAATGRAAAGRADEDWKRIQHRAARAWVVCWGAASSPSATSSCTSRCCYLVVAVLLVFLFAMVNGISLGISD